MPRIALDAMGGDFAPDATVSGAILALAHLDDSHVIQLVGQEDVVAEALSRLLPADAADSAALRRRLEVVNASEVIDMADKPAAAVRGKPNSSMVVGLKLQKDGLSDAFVSAGNTGAQMAASSMLLRLIPPLTRPAIATSFPTDEHAMLVLDSGANVDCSAAELVQFAHLGAVYAQAIMGRGNPRIALLSIGEEAEKGNLVVKEANQLLAASGLNFVGNVEGRDLPHGRTEKGPIDVVVCDGFVGNIVLKMFEAMGPMVMHRLATRLKLNRSDLANALSDLDYSEHGGAPLLGVRGISIIAHGKSSARAIQNAIMVAARAISNRFSEKIAQSLAALPGPS